MIKLEKGAPVRVRLHNSEVVEAVYDCACKYIEKHHWVIVGRLSKVAGYSATITSCRFVGPACDLVPVGVSV